MELSKLKIEKKNKLYLNQYQYRASVKVPGIIYVPCSKSLSWDKAWDNFQKLDEKMNHENGVIQYAKTKFYHPAYKQYALHKDVVDLNSIKNFLLWLKDSDSTKFSYLTSPSSVSIFTDDIKILDSLSTITDEIDYYHVLVLEKDTLYFKNNPKYKFRTYFRHKKMTESFSDDVRELSNTYKKEIIHFSPSLKRQLFSKNQPYHSYRWLHSSYFIDYNDEKMLTILAMYFPGLLSKTYKLEKEP